MARRQYGREVWQRLCEFAATDPSPLSFSGGVWTARKLFFLCHYLEQTTRAMAGNPKFPNGLCYIDLFASSGICDVRYDSGTIRRYPGSALIAAGMPRPFSRLIMVDKSSDKLDACVERIRRIGFTGQVERIASDANRVVEQITNSVPHGSLNVAFVDPLSLDIDYATIERLAAGRPLDLIILFADAYDIVRNVAEYYYPRRSNNLDKFLGEHSHWRKRWDVLHDRSGPNVRQMFAEVYLEQLARIGYKHSRSWPIDGPSGPVYRLVFASKHPLGLKFCEIALNEDFEGTKGLFGAG